MSAIFLPPPLPPPPPPRMCGYEMINANAGEISETINRWLKRGWVLYGVPTVIYKSTGDVVYQAIVKYEGSRGC